MTKSGHAFAFGEDSNDSFNDQMACFGLTDEDCFVAKYLVPYFDSLSTKTMSAFTITSTEQTLFDGYFPDQYGVSGKYPNQGNELDLSVINASDIYLFLAEADLDCPAFSAIELANSMLNVQNTITYGCDADHSWFGGKGLG